MEKCTKKAHYHLPGLFEFYDLYSIFVPLFFEHPEYFYDWCDIGSIYGSPSDCIWGGGRVGFGDNECGKVLDLLNQYNISPRLTFSNSLLNKEHLTDRKCNRLCSIFENSSKAKSGVIIYSDILLEYLQKKYPAFYYVSSTTKVITDFAELMCEVNRSEFSYVVPDFRLNKAFNLFETMSDKEKDKIEFLCNEGCWPGCKDRKKCYENVSLKNLGEECEDHICTAPESKGGYVFSKAMEGPLFIGTKDIVEKYLPLGFSNFKIEGRGLGSAIVLEFLLYYMTKSEYHLKVREKVYLDSMLDLL